MIYDLDEKKKCRKLKDKAQGPGSVDSTVLKGKTIKVENKRITGCRNLTSWIFI